MATKASKAIAAKKPGRTATDSADLRAEVALNAATSAAMVLELYDKPLANPGFMPLVVALTDQMDAVKAGDMRQAEAMLYGQAHALQAIFMNLSRRAASQEYLKHWEANLRMAMKAQNQCRMTLETLATIKNPPVMFARQANINNGGLQQVNNGAGVEALEAPRAPATKSAAAQTELLEASDGQRLDTGAASATGGADPHLEAVGEVHRT